MLIINDTQIQEEGEIYERPYITRGIKKLYRNNNR